MKNFGVLRIIVEGSLRGRRQSAVSVISSPDSAKIIPVAGVGKIVFIVLSIHAEGEDHLFDVADAFGPVSLRLGAAEDGEEQSS